MSRVAVQPLVGGDPGQVAGYQVHGRLGVGGMGVVYLASTALGQPVALKVLRPEFGDDPEFRARFRQEVEAARRVGGQHTAKVLDADPEASPPWLATAYVPGPSLQEAVAAHGPLPVQTVLSLVMGVADALTAIHAAGIVHRDLKPSNVLLASDGPRVIDFGIARAVETSGVTQTGTAVGSPQYMAPEQVRGDAVTAASDIWALGALASFAATGRPPFGEGADAAVLYRVVHDEPDLSGCPAELTGIIAACLAKDAPARPSLAQATQWCQAELSAAAAPARAWLPPVLAAGLASYAAPTLPTATGMPAPAANQPVASPPAADTVPTVITHSVSPAPGGAPARPGWRGFSRPVLIAACTAAAVLVGLAAYGAVALASNRGQSGSSHGALPQTHHSARPTAAASKAPSPSPSSTLDQCLFGTWRQTLEQFPDTFNGVPVTFSGGAGVTQVFTPAGVNTLTYHNATYTAHENGITWTQVDNGTATVNYTTQDGMLLSSNLVQSGTWTLYKNGSVNNSGPLDENIAPDRYVCSGNSLQLFAPNGDSIDLTRTS